MLEFPIGIMQGNTQVSWLATRGLSPLPQGSMGKQTRHALCPIQNSMPWFRGYAEVLILRTSGNEQNNMPWFRGYAGVLILRAFGSNHNNNYNTRGPLSQESCPCESMGQKSDLYTEHFIPSHGLFTLGK